MPMRKREPNNAGCGTILIIWENLQLVFITLKVCGAVSWPWWLTLSPAWVSVCIFILMVVFAALIAAARSDGDQT